MRPASVALRSSGGRRLGLLVAAALCALVTAIAVARADGEAGVVIDRLTSAGVLRRAPRSRRAPVWLAGAVLDEVADLSTRIQRSSRRMREG